MSTITLAEAEAQLVTVSAAISTLLTGKRISELEVGSGSFKRRYKYTEITLSSLQALRDELLAIISSLSPATLPKFAQNMTIPLLVRKGSF
jgi:hypothetical protein